MKQILLLLTLTVVEHPSWSQGVQAFNNGNATAILMGQDNNHALFKASVIIGTTGSTIGIGYGIWKENPALQYSLNTCLQWRVGKSFLGNFRDAANPHDGRSRSQLVFMFSPMLTAHFGNSYYVYQELEPFYLGSANAVFSRYKYSATIGTTFTASPRGTDKNTATVRNRTQQVAMLSFNLKNLNITGYDDYMSVLTSWLQLGDNWDRYFTGGLFVRYRFNDQYTFHLYSEVYTGINRANPFTNPDVMSYKIRKKQWKLKNYANQDPGQEYFNSAWLVAKLTYAGIQPISNKAGIYKPGYEFYLGSNAPWTMFSQTSVHSMIRYDPSNNLKLHYFINRSNVPGNLDKGGTGWLTYNFYHLFFGAGLHYNMTSP